MRALGETGDEALAREVGRAPRPRAARGRHRPGLRAGGGRGHEPGEPGHRRPRLLARPGRRGAARRGARRAGSSRRASPPARSTSPATATRARTRTRTCRASRTRSSGSSRSSSRPSARSPGRASPSVMTAHVVFEALDPGRPATLSPEVMRLLRARGRVRGLRRLRRPRDEGGRRALPARGGRAGRRSRPGWTRCSSATAPTSSTAPSTSCARRVEDGRLAARAARRGARPRRGAAQVRRAAAGSGDRARAAADAGAPRARAPDPRARRGARSDGRVARARASVEPVERVGERLAHRALVAEHRRDVARRRASAAPQPQCSAMRRISAGGTTPSPAVPTTMAASGQDRGGQRASPRSARGARRAPRRAASASSPVARRARPSARRGGARRRAGRSPASRSARDGDDRARERHRGADHRRHLPAHGEAGHADERDAAARRAASAGARAPPGRWPRP